MVKKIIEKNSSNSSTRSGNTKQISPARHWCFTLNNPTKDERNVIKNLSSSIVPTIVFQDEHENTHHIQGYLMFAKKSRPFSIIPIERIHWEKTRNIQQSKLYCTNIEKRCTKDNCSDKEVYLRGWRIPRELKLIEPTYTWQQNILTMLKNKPDDRKIYWYWSMEGGVGKTQFSKYVVETYKPYAIVVGGKASDVRNAIVQYYNTNKDYPDIVIVNIPRSFNSEYMSYEALENLKDMFFYSGKYEGGMISGPIPHVLVFANEPPNKEKMSKDRFNVTQLDAALS